MDALIKEKLAQACTLVEGSGADLWMVFDRETAEGGDPVLPFLMEGGLTWQSALLISPRGRKVAVVGNFDAPMLEASGNWHEVIPYVQHIREPLLKAIEGLVPAERTTPRIAVDFSTSDDKADGLKHGMYLLLEEYLRGTRFAGSLVSAEEIAGALRARKTPGEVVRIRAAIAETDRLFADVASFIRPGRSEREIYDHIQARIDETGFGYSWDRAGNPIVNAGPDSMIGHGIPSPDIRVAPGQIVHLDLGIVKDGYSSDMQRCWYVRESGQLEIPGDVRRALEAVNGAITAGADALRPGVAGWKVDEAARRFLVGAGYPEYMHALGHQVGRLAHDGGGVLGPRWERYGRTPDLAVEAEQIYTLELEVMVERRGCLGLEEMVRVTPAGCEWLTARQTGLPVIG